MRLLRHLFPPSAGRLFPADSLERIADAIHQGEQRHRGEVMFAVEPDLPLLAVLRGMQARERAHEAFARLRTWDTEANNGVLIYLLLADHRIEIVADRGLRGRVSDEQWRGVCQLMEERLRAGEAETAVIRGIAAVSDLLAAFYPQDGSQPNEDELPNRPHIF
ncbi:TPM domain-containing protein [Pseudoxanthomonas beigongshangi]